MRAVTLSRFLLAVCASSVAGSAIFALGAAIDNWTSNGSMLTPLDSFHLSFVYSIFLSLPAVGAAVAIFGFLTDHYLPAYLTHRRLYVLIVGLFAGAILAMPMVFLGVPLWGTALIGVLWGSTSAAAGLLILPTPKFENAHA